MGKSTDEHPVTATSRQRGHQLRERPTPCPLTLQPIDDVLQAGSVNVDDATQSNSPSRLDLFDEHATEERVQVLRLTWTERLLGDVHIANPLRLCARVDGGQFHLFNCVTAVHAI